MTIKEFLTLLQKVKKNSNGWTALCPAHHDKQSSLSVKEGANGQIVLFCHAKCSFDSICTALNVRQRELMSNDIDPIQTININGANAQKRIVAVYKYTDESSKLLYENVRYEPKGFSQRRSDNNGGFNYSLNDVRRVPYRLPELLSALEEKPAQNVFLTEGEKDCDNIRAQGFVASSFKNWREEFNQYIKNANVVLLIDHDESGIRQANEAAQIIHGTAKSLKIVDLHESEPLPEKHGKDVSNWLEAGNKIEALEQFLVDVPAWKPKEGTNILKIGCTFGELQNTELPKREEIIKGLGRGEVGLVNAITDVGKTTLIRNTAISLILGRAFLPLTTGGKCYRIAIIDSEDTLNFLRYDIQTMIKDLSVTEKELIRQNLFLICDVSFGDEDLKLNKPEHFRCIVAALADFKPDVVFVDTISSSFSIRNENDNAEVKESVMKPLKRLARTIQTIVFAAHHIGKAKLEEGATKEAAHRGRGASAFSDMPRVVLNLERNVETEVILSCAKLKGEKFPDTILKLNRESRWFSVQGISKLSTNYENLLEIFKEGKSYKRKEIDDLLEGEMSKATITRSLADAIRREDLIKQKGCYSKKTQMLTPNSDEHLSINPDETNTTTREVVEL